MFRQANCRDAPARKRLDAPEMTNANRAVQNVMSRWANLTSTSPGSFYSCHRTNGSMETSRFFIEGLQSILTRGALGYCISARQGVEARRVA